MAETRVRKAGEEQLSEVEIVALRNRFAQESKEAVTVSALAEAADLEVEAVREHLRQIRTERAFRREATPAASTERPNWYWAAVGAVALIMAGGITYRRLQADQADRFVYVPLIVLPPAQTPQSATSRTQATYLPQFSDGRIGRVPLGFRAVAAVLGRQQTSLGMSGKLVPGPYQAQVEMIAQAIEEMANLANSESKTASASTRPQPPFADALQNRFSIEPGEFHFAVDGWAGRIVGKLRFPIGARERAQIRESVEGMFSQEKAAQESALGPASNEGIVTPPPGYRIQFGGRRMDQQDGPPLSFAPVPVDLVRRRLEAALLNAVKRDSTLPRGRWTENAQGERQIPAATRYAGLVEGPGGLVPFDIPAGPPAVLKQGIRDVAAKAAHQVTAINAEADSVVRIQGDGTVRK